MSAAVTRDSRSRAWQLLDRPLAWEALRCTLDATFGLYRCRMGALERWGILEDAPSVLDVGCGTGQYAAVTTGRYLGVDITASYIGRARHRWRDNPSREFRAADVTTLEVERRTFDLVLMVDLLHHLDDATCAGLLRSAAQLSRRYVISLEPVAEQHGRVGQWIIDHDRGDHMRSVAAYHMLFEQSPLIVERGEDLLLGPIRTLAVLARSCADPDSHTDARDARETNA
jgi:SAM-dependent methyltransferase